MRRAIAALVVTVAVVVWLARYETHPPRAAPSRPGPKVIAGPVFTTPFSAIQVGVVMSHGRVVDVKTLILTGDGEHTQMLLREIGYDDARIQALKISKII